MNSIPRIILAGFIILSLSTLNSTIVSADEVSELKALVHKLLNRVDELEKKVEQYESKEASTTNKINSVANRVSQVEEAHEHVRQSVHSQPTPMGDLLNEIDISLGLTSIYQFTHNANGDSLSQNGEDVGDGTWSLDLELSKEFDDYASAYMLLEAGQGGGVDEELKIFSPVNFDATGGSGTLEMVEGWYEQYIQGTTLTFGKLDGTIYIDTNEFANDEAGQFLGSMFRNNPTIQFPDNGAGFRVTHTFNDHYALDAVLMDGDGDWEDIFDGPFVAGQVNFLHNLFDRHGHYRVYGWGNFQDHTKFSDSGSTENSNYGMGLSFDQELTDLVGIFMRFGFQDPEVFLTGGDSINIEQAFSLGMQMTGAPWGRDDDTVGIAFGQAIPSIDYQNANSGFQAEPESHIETYYSYVVNDHLTVSPIVHVIINPYGGDATNGDKTIVVGGLRGQVNFN